MIKRSIAIVLFIVLSGSVSYGWNGHGHMLVAAIAYSRLTDDQKSNVIDLLRDHQDYKAWKNLYKASAQTVDLGTFIVMQAATWPDEIRDTTSPDHQYHRPEWHYITYKMRFPGKAETTLPNPKDEPNVVWAIENARVHIEDKTLSKRERAMYLCWLIHLIGDIHQPLHCASLFSTTYPQGDLGGNKFFVAQKKKGTNLHSLWDGSLGTNDAAGGIRKQATSLVSDYSITEVNTNYNPRAWSLESFKHAVTQGHLNGKLKGSTDKYTAPELPEGYVTDMKALASQRAAWGGYRLGAAIQKLHITPFHDHDGE